MEDIAEMIFPIQAVDIVCRKNGIEGKDIINVVIDYDNYLLSEEVSESLLFTNLIKKTKYNQHALDTFIEYLRVECEEKIKRVY